MKLLVVFVSALVVLAHGNVTPSDEDDNVYEIQSEVVAGYAVVAGQEAGGPQDVFAEEVPVVVFGAEAEPRIDSPQEPAAENVQIPEAGVYISLDTPQAYEACNLTKCANHCDRLGFKYNNKCKNNMCDCYN